MAFLSVSITGNTDLVAANPGKVVIVESLFLIAGAAVTITFQSVTTGNVATNITGGMVLATPFKIEIDSVQMGLFQTNPGEGLRLAMSSGVAVNGFMRYSLRG